MPVMRGSLVIWRQCAPPSSERKSPGTMMAKILQSYFYQTFQYIASARANNKAEMNKASDGMNILFQSLHTIPETLKSILEEWSPITRAFYTSRGRLTDAINESLSKQFLKFVNYAQTHDGAFKLDDISKVFGTITNAWLQWIVNMLSNGRDNVQAKKTLFLALPHFVAHLCSFTT